MRDSTGDAIGSPEWRGRTGYEVTIGANTLEKREELISRTNGHARVGSFEDAARFGDIIVLATKGSAAEAALRAAGIDHLRGKAVIDTTNPIADAPPVNGVLQYFTSQNESLMERLQRLAPEALLVKSFSCVGNAFMVNPDFSGVRPTMFICGNDDGRRTRSGASWTDSGSRSRTWGRSKQLAPSSRFACCGASPVSSTTNGHTPSSC